ECRFRLAPVASRLMESAEVERDLGVQIRLLLETGQPGNLGQDRPSLLDAIEAAELAGIEIASLVIGRIQLADALAGGQSVIVALEGNIERNQSAVDRRSPRIESQGFLEGSHGLDEAVIELVKTGKAEKLDSFGVVALLARGGADGNVGLWSILGRW